METNGHSENHHRRSIRLKGHDYAGGGVYFITVCAHRDAGKIFAPPAVRDMVAREWESVGAGLVPALGLVPAHGNGGGYKTRPYIVMPDHFHALVAVPRGEVSLGDVVGAFKSRVLHEYVMRVKAGEWPRFPGHIWQRNYYEVIVRSPEAEGKIAEYIRMNPWRCVQNFGDGLRGMGNPALWGRERIGMLASRGGNTCGALPRLPDGAVIMSGFHSPMERAALDQALDERRPVIWCPAWELDRLAFVPGVREALEENRMLILEMRDRDGTLAAAEQRNRFILQQADRLWLPHVATGGMLARLLAEMDAGSPGLRDKVLTE